jgi:hypothetical protein
VVLVKGPDRKQILEDGVLNSKGETVAITKERFAQTYTWIEWESVNNRFIGWPDNSSALAKLNMYADDYFKSNIWIWDGKPHWAYNTKNMILVDDRNALYWTPNTIKAEVKIKGEEAVIELMSNTPNLATYHMQDAPNGEWMDISNPVSISLKSSTNEIQFRTMNKARVPGIPYKVIVSR